MPRWNRTLVCPDTKLAIETRFENEFASSYQLISSENIDTLRCFPSCSRQGHQKRSCERKVVAKFNVPRDYLLNLVDKLSPLDFFAVAEIRQASKAMYPMRGQSMDSQEIEPFVRGKAKDATKPLLPGAQVMYHEAGTHVKFTFEFNTRLKNNSAGWHFGWRSAALTHNVEHVLCVSLLLKNLPGHKTLCLSVLQSTAFLLQRKKDPSLISKNPTTKGSNEHVIKTEEAKGMAVSKVLSFEEYAVVKSQLLQLLLKLQSSGTVLVAIPSLRKDVIEEVKKLLIRLLMGKKGYKSLPQKVDMNFEIRRLKKKGVEITSAKLKVMSELAAYLASCVEFVQGMKKLEPLGQAILDGFIQGVEEELPNFIPNNGVTLRDIQLQFQVASIRPNPKTNDLAERIMDSPIPLPLHPLRLEEDVFKSAKKKLEQIEEADAEHTKKRKTKASGKETGTPKPKKRRKDKKDKKETPKDTSKVKALGAKNKSVKSQETDPKQEEQTKTGEEVQMVPQHLQQPLQQSLQQGQQPQHVQQVAFAPGPQQVIMVSGPGQQPIYQQVMGPGVRYIQNLQVNSPQQGMVVPFGIPSNTVQVQQNGPGPGQPPQQFHPQPMQVQGSPRVVYQMIQQPQQTPQGMIQVHPQGMGQGPPRGPGPMYQVPMQPGQGSIQVAQHLPQAAGYTVMAPQMIMQPQQQIQVQQQMQAQMQPIYVQVPAGSNDGGIAPAPNENKGDDGN